MNEVILGFAEWSGTDIQSVTKGYVIWWNAVDDNEITITKYTIIIEKEQIKRIINIRTETEELYLLYTIENRP